MSLCSIWVLALDKLVSEYKDSESPAFRTRSLNRNQERGLGGDLFSFLVLWLFNGVFSVFSASFSAFWRGRACYTGHRVHFGSISFKI